MDKNTLSNYGWIVIAVLVLSVMIALATPFGTYVGDAVVSVANGFVGASDVAIDEDNIATNEDKWDSKFDYSGFDKTQNTSKDNVTELPSTPDPDPDPDTGIETPEQTALPIIALRCAMLLHLRTKG